MVELKEFYKHISWIDEDDIEIVTIIDDDNKPWNSQIENVEKYIRMVIVKNTEDKFFGILYPIDERLNFPNIQKVTKSKKMRVPDLNTFSCYESNDAIISPLGILPEIDDWVISKSLEPLVQQIGLRVAIQVSKIDVVILSMSNLLQTLRRRNLKNLYWYSPKEEIKLEQVATPQTQVQNTLETKECPVDLSLGDDCQTEAFWITSKEHPMVADFLDLKSNQLDDKIISEGGDTLIQLLKSNLTIDVILLKDTQFVKHKDIIRSVNKKCRIAVVDRPTLKAITTYKSVGPGTVLASAFKPNLPDFPVLQYRRILALDGLVDAENIGSLIRSAACFGIDCILLSQDCCDVWYRRSIRVSMGHVFHIPTYRVNLEETLKNLATEWKEDGAVYGAIVQDDTELLKEIGPIPNSWCLVVGSEHFGISESVRQQCTRKVKIEMSPVVDSLNVGVAAAILLHHLAFTK